MSEKIGAAVWFLALALANLLLFALTRAMSPTFWITFAFVWTAFLSSLVFQLYLAKRSKAPDDSLLHIPALAVSLVYEATQIPVSVIFALGSAVIAEKVALLVQGVLLIVAWSAALLALCGNTHIKKVNRRQRDHITNG